jgi:hypothetical protein
MLVCAQHLDGTANLAAFEISVYLFGVCIHVLFAIKIGVVLVLSAHKCLRPLVARDFLVIWHCAWKHWETDTLDGFVFTLWCLNALGHVVTVAAVFPSCHDGLHVKSQCSGRL